LSRPIESVGDLDLDGNVNVVAAGRGRDVERGGTRRP
jgi:hypothetical protein